MNALKPILFCLLGLLAFVALGQGTQPVQRTVNGVLQSGTTVRDLTKYPLTPAGNRAYRADLRKGRLVISTGSVSSPPAGFAYQPLTASSRSTLRPIFNTSGLKLQLNLKEGRGGNQYNENGLAGGIEWLGFADQPNRNLICVPHEYIDGAVHDEVQGHFYYSTGHGVQMCYYAGPVPYTVNGPNYAGQVQLLTSKNLGYNPLQDGDGFGNNSQLVTYGVSSDGKTIYRKNVPKLFADAAEDAVFNRSAEAQFESWYVLDDQSVDLYFKSQFNRTDNPPQLVVQQENPCMFLNPTLETLVWYDGDAPGTNAPTRSIRLDDTYNGGSLMKPGGHYMTEPLLMAIGSDGRGIGVIGFNEGDFNLRGQIGKRGEGFGDGTTNLWTYINAAPMQILDANGTWYSRAKLVTGTVAQMRAQLYALGQPKPTPEYRFNKAGRQDWWFNDKTHDDGYQASRSSWKVYFDQNRAGIVSPAGAWKAASMPHLYMKVRYTGPKNQLNLMWRRARQKYGGIDQSQLALENFRYPDGNYEREEQMYQFGVVSGQWVIVDCNLQATKSEWKGIINELNIGLKYDWQRAPGETLEIEWISANPNGPAN